MTERSKQLLEALQTKRDNPVRLDLVDKLKTNLIDNKTFLAISAPTNAQNAAQIKQITRQVNRLIRLAINDLLTSE